MALIGDSTAVSGAAAGTQSAASKAKLEDDLNRFLNLLVTQLKNQDPLDPLDANEFTSQLVQFASVEQQIFQNANLEKLLQLEETNQISQLASFIGTTVESTGRRVPLENSKASFAYTIPSGAASASITITNASGLTVFQVDADTSPGKHTFEWDGRNQFGTIQPDGDYNVLVSGLDFPGNLLEIDHTVFGRINGAAVENGQANLLMGANIVVPQDAVLSLKETPVDEGSGG